MTLERDQLKKKKFIKDTEVIQKVLQLLIQDLDSIYEDDNYVMDMKNSGEDSVKSKKDTLSSIWLIEARIGIRREEQGDST